MRINQELRAELEASRALCQTSLERSCWAVVVAKDIRKICPEPTKAETAYLNKLGIIA